MYSWLNKISYYRMVRFMACLSDYLSKRSAFGSLKCGPFTPLLDRCKMSNYVCAKTSFSPTFRVMKFTAVCNKVGGVDVADFVYFQPFQFKAELVQAIT